MNGKQIVALVIGSLAAGCVSEPPATGSLQARLNSLMQEKETPKDKITSACCYAPPYMPDLSETKFICPSCGRTTLYPASKSTYASKSLHSGRDYDRRQAVDKLVRALKNARQLLAEMQPAAASYGLNMEVDNLDLCASCRHSPRNAMPSLYLTVIRENGTRHQTPCTILELQILKDFLTTKTWKPQHQYDIPLRDHADTIQKLLGITPS